MLLIVGTVGFTGAFCRHIVTIVYNKIFPHTLWHYSTLFINLLGCFLIGLIVPLFAQKPDRDLLSAFFITGYLGGFTTYSTFCFESLKLLQTQSLLNCLCYIGLHLIGGLIFVFIGGYFSLQR